MTQTKKAKRKGIAFVLGILFLLSMASIPFFASNYAGNTIENTNGLPDSFAYKEPDTFRVPITIWDQKRDGYMFEAGNIRLTPGLVKSDMENGFPVRDESANSVWRFTQADFNRWWTQEVRDPNGTTDAEKYNSLQIDSGSLVFKKNANGTYSCVQNGSFFALNPGRGIVSKEDEQRAKSFSGLTNGNNYFFTMKMQVPFTYYGGETFNFTGDDDVWVFIGNDENTGKLALDLGGVHSAVSDSIVFGNGSNGVPVGSVRSSHVNGGKAQDLGLVVGQTYYLTLFYAERQTVASNLNITTSLQVDTFSVDKQGTVNADKSGIDYMVTVQNTQKNVPITITHLSDWMNNGESYSADGRFVQFGQDGVSGLSYSYSPDGPWEPVEVSAPSNDKDGFKLTSPIQLQQARAEGDTVYFKYSYTLNETDKTIGSVYNKLAVKTNAPGEMESTVLFDNDVTPLEPEFAVKKSVAIYNPAYAADLSQHTFTTDATVPYNYRAVFKVEVENNGAGNGVAAYSDLFAQSDNPERDIPFSSDIVSPTPNNPSLTLAAGEKQTYYYVTNPLTAAGYTNTAALIPAGGTPLTAAANVTVSNTIPFSINYYKTNEDKPFTSSQFSVNWQSPYVTHKEIDTASPLATPELAGYTLSHVTFVQDGTEQAFNAGQITITPANNTVNVYYTPKSTPPASSTPTTPGSSTPTTPPPASSSSRRPGGMGSSSTAGSGSQSGSSSGGIGGLVSSGSSSNGDSTILPNPPVPETNLDTGTWSLVNVLCACIGILGSFVLFLLQQRSKKTNDDAEEEVQEEPEATTRTMLARQKLFGYLAMVIGLLTGLLTFILEDFSANMALFSKWSYIIIPLFILAFACYLASLVMGNMGTNNEDPKEEPEDTENFEQPSPSV